MGVAIEPVDVEKVAEENPQSRFHVVNNPNLAPGVCVVCGSAGGDGRQFVDFSKTMDYYGVFYFCTFCVAEMATMLGFAPKSDWVTAEANLQKEISAGDDRYVEAKVQLDAARILLRSCTCDPDSTNPTVLDSLEANPEPESDNSEADEPIGLEGFDDLPGFGSDDESEKPKRRRSNSSAG